MKLFRIIATSVLGTAMAMGAGLALANSQRDFRQAKADGTVTFNTTNSEIANTGTNKTITVDGVTLTFSNVTAVAAGNIQNAKNATITSTAFSSAITQVKVFDCQTTSTATDGTFTVYGGTSSDAINTQIEEVTGLSSTAADKEIDFDGSYTFFKIVVGSARVLKHSRITVSYGTPKILQSISLTKDDAQTVKNYTVGDTPSTAGLTVMATYDSGDPVDVTDKATITPTPATVVKGTTSVSYIASFGGKESNPVVVTGVTVERKNPISVLYTMAKDDVVSNIYGYFVGALDTKNVIIMDGEYGIVAYNGAGISVEGYAENETILKISGKIDIYKGLYEITNATVVAESSPDVLKPVVYSAKGGETQEYANRVTTVTGVPSVVSGDLAGDAGAADITLSFAVADKTVQVFYKKARQNAADMAKLATAVSGSGTITVKGFTGWYNAFQVQMTGLVEEKESYTAEQFAQELLTLTDAVCEGYVNGDDNHDAIEGIWSTLAGEQKYPSLPAAQKTILASADANESGTVIEQAMARYDFLTVRYNLNNFINGRLSEPSNFMQSTVKVNNIAIIIVIASIAAISSVGIFLMIHNRKHQ